MAHKTHYYQRLVQMGWGHRKTTLVEYCAMLVAAFGALVAVKVPASIQWVLVFLFIAAYSTAVGIILKMENERRDLRRKELR